MELRHRRQPRQQSDRPVAPVCLEVQPLIIVFFETADAATEEMSATYV